MSLPTPADLALLSDEDAEAAYRECCAALGLHSQDEIDARLAELAGRGHQLSAIRAAYPLACARLWVRDDAEWDQRRLVRELRHPLTLVLGGNRGGKTYALLEWLVAQALGRDHPAVECWLHDNDLDPDQVPRGPGEVYAVAPSAASSIKIHRRDIDALLPQSRHWRGMHASAEAMVEIPCPGYREPAVIWFKSVDQGHRAFKGDQMRAVGISEEPDGDEGRLVLDECMRGCSSTGGRVVVEMTPQNGMTWTHDDLLVDRRYDCRIVSLVSSHNVLVPDHASLLRWLASLSPEERRMREFGEFVDRRGQVYAGWSRGDGDRWGLGHLCEPFEIPRDWPRYRGHDFGQTQRNGTGCLWFAEGDDALYCYREYYLANEPSFAVHARNVLALQPRDERISGAWGDPASAEGREAFAAAGLPMDPADNELAGGISRCAERLRVVGSRPRMKVFRTCTEFTRQIEAYRRDPNARDGRPIKRDDHLPDCWRYVESGLHALHERRARASTHTRALSGLIRRMGG